MEVVMGAGWGTLEVETARETDQWEDRGQAAGSPHWLRLPEVHRPQELGLHMARSSSVSCPSYDDFGTKPITMNATAIVSNIYKTLISNN